MNHQHLFKPTTLRFLITGIFISALFFLCPTAALQAHGVELKVKESAPVIFVKADYSGGSALKNTEVVIRFETEKTARAIFQRAQTDLNGYFSFTPHLPGTWIISVDDGMGHMGEEEITLTEDFFNQPTLTGGKGKSKTPALLTNSTCCYLLKILLVVLLILMITLILSRTKKRQEAKDQETKDHDTH